LWTPDPVWTVMEKRKSLATAWIKILHPVASHYTNYTIPARVHVCWFVGICAHVCMFTWQFMSSGMWCCYVTGLAVPNISNNDGADILPHVW